jgi:hypothetical protein
MIDTTKFDIPNFYKVEMTFGQAVSIMEMFGDSDDVLNGMKKLNDAFTKYCETPQDEEFADIYCYEVNAYNMVFDNMSKLFHDIPRDKSAFTLTRNFL